MGKLWKTFIYNGNPWVFQDTPTLRLNHSIPRHIHQLDAVCLSKAMWDARITHQRVIGANLTPSAILSLGRKSYAPTSDSFGACSTYRWDIANGIYHIEWDLTVNYNV